MNASIPAPLRPARSVIDLIGSTPLVRLNRASAATGCEIWGKAEFLNPGQSVKDRAALWIIRDAERRGDLRPGGLIVEGTAGNTGIGLAMVGSALGYRTLIVIPRTQTQEKKDAIRMAGAELVEVDAVPYANPGNYVRFSGRLAEEKAKTEPNGAIWANQFDNIANRQAHVESTGPEIWAETGGQVDGFICAVGSGGTLAGVAEGSSITEGIGQGRITKNLEGLRIDHAYRIADDEALEQIFDLAEHEGLNLGGSSGINIAGAIRLARDLGPGKTIVTILCDYGARYQSKLYNPAFLAERGLPVPAWL